MNFKKNFNKSFNILLLRILIIFVFILVSFFIIIPLIPLFLKSFSDNKNNFVGLENFINYIQNPSLTQSFINSLKVALTTTFFSVFIGFIYAYALTRTRLPFKKFFNTFSLFSLYIPPLAVAIGLIYIFGKQGLITQGFFGTIPGFDINLYGFNGIIIGEIFYCFPQALIILVSALNLSDQRLYEAAESLKASPLRKFLTITLPNIKYGLMNSFFICFILSFPDFGVPKVVGGNFNVLATDIYKQVVGQQNFAMGATISIYLLVPSILAFLIDKNFQKNEASLISGKSIPFKPRKNLIVDSIMFIFCSLILILVIGVFSSIVLASLIKIWPYDISLSLQNFRFSNVAGNGYEPYFNTVFMSIYTAIFGTIFVFFTAYLVEKFKPLKKIRMLIYFFSTLPIAIPGLVLGLSYILFFNKPSFSIPFLDFQIFNPFSLLYGTMGILVLANIIHFFTVCFISATTTLKQIDKEFEEVSESLKVPFYKTFLRITIPLSLPTILEIGSYYFVNSMITVSAIIFLYPAKIPVSSVSIVNMDDAGDTASAAAMSTLIVLTSLFVRLIYEFTSRNVSKKSSVWINPLET